MATWVNILDVLYPVGAVYFSTASTSPASTVGGSWTQIKGAVIAAYGSNGYILKNYGGSLAISNSHLPANMGETQIRSLLGTTDMFVLGGTGIIKVPMEDWDGEHAAVQDITGISNYQYQKFKLQGGGQTSCLDTLEFISGTGQRSCPCEAIEQPNYFTSLGGDLVWQLL